MGLGLGFGLENKERLKEDLRHYYAFDGKLRHHSLLVHVCQQCIVNNVLLGGGVRVRVWIREQRKIKRRSKALLCL